MCRLPDRFCACRRCRYASVGNDSLEVATLARSDVEVAARCGTLAEATRIKGEHSIMDQPAVEEPIPEGPAAELSVGQLTAERLRRSIVEIDDQVRALPADAFAEKYRLQTEGDELRRALWAVADPGDEVLASWAERAAGKNAQAVDDEVELARANISSPYW